MAVNIPSLTSQQERSTLATRVRAVPAGAILAGLVLASFAGRLAAAIPHSTPRLFPDEYIYAQLARSLAHGRLTIRGHATHFPALLEPLLAAPLWLFGDVETAFRLTQALHALVASLVAVPLYLLTRKLGFPAWQRLSCSACALALPSLIYSSYVTADALGMTLAVTAVYAGVCALETPTTRREVTFVAFALLATFARVQYVVLLPAFAAAAVVMTGGRPLRALHRHRVTVALVFVPVLAAVALGNRGLGYYQNVLSLHIGTDALRWAAIDAMLLVYAAGYVLVPGALVGIATALGRPRSATDRALGALTASLALLLLVEASLYAANGTNRFQERYLVALLPLVPVFFCLCVARPGSRRTGIVAGAVSIGLVIIAARVPLSSYTSVLSNQDSPMLQAVAELQQLTSPGTGALVIALAVVVLTAPGMLAFARPRLGVAAALVSSLLVLAVATVGAVVTDVDYTRVIERNLPTDLRWVDHSGLRNVSVLVTRSTLRPVVSTHLFWNDHLTRLLQMREGPDVVDAFGYSRVRVLRDGTIVADGKPVTGSILVEESVNAVTFENARLIRRDRGSSLWQGDGPIRLLTLTYGRFGDGWLGWPYTTVTVWPSSDGVRTGALCLPFSLPDVGAQATLSLSGPGYRRSVTIASGGRTVVAIPLKITRVWRLHVSALRPFRLGSRLASAKVDPPRFMTGKASSTTCR